MKRLALLLGLVGCVQTHSVSLTFGSDGEGLDGFMCKDPTGAMLLSRLPSDGQASLVIDFVRLGGVAGCRTGQLVEWCSTHSCAPIASTRSCVELKLPSPAAGVPREELRAQLLAAMRAPGAKEALADAPDEFVLVRVVGTTERCADVLPAANASLLPAFDKAKLVGCAYSCPVYFDRTEQPVYLGFETLTAQCEQGVRICSDQDLHWQP
jgi:hypothetical protein